ncbi:hypothetical protein [Desulfonatronospira thiodismutans]|nr:hypothetical protein [Desulfonatronospira thiodismutans]
MDQNTAARVFSIDQSRSPQVLMVENEPVCALICVKSFWRSTWDGSG